MSAAQYELPSPPSDAISAVQYYPRSDDHTNSTKLLVSSWDRHVYLYETSTESEARIIHSYEHEAPVLDVCWGGTAEEAFTAGLDLTVRRINLTNGEQEILSTHDAGVCALAYDKKTNLLVSASWDKTLHLHQTDSNAIFATIPLPSKPFTISMSPTNLVVAMSNRKLNIWTIESLKLLGSQSQQAPPNIIRPEPMQERESSLKFMTRAVACMPSDAGFACSSIEGRVAVEWFDGSAESQARKYAFKCHRQPASQPDDSGQPFDIVYPVHSLAFHPQYGTFVSGGGDGVVALWDATAKRRIRQYQKYPTSVAAMSFSNDGHKLAIAICPSFEDAKEDLGDGPTKVFIRDLAEAEAKGKAPA